MRPERYSTLVAIAAVILVITLLVPARAQQPTDEPTFRMALTGDSIITRKLSIHQEPTFLSMIELIRGADAAFTNIEMLFHDFEYPPMHQSGGTYMRAPPALVDELVWAGFDLGSLANNHAGDYGSGAMLASARYVAGGVGASLAEAREAKFLDTGKGRIALISVSSTFPDHSRAGRSRNDIPARPGLNPLRHIETTIVTRDRLESLRGILRDLGRTPPDGDSLSFFGRRFEVGNTPGTRSEPHAGDLESIASVVRNASRLADYTMVTIHAHEGAETRLVPAEFLVTFARAMVDAGADMFVGHGPHVLRGIEIYKDAPIFYSLGDFMFQNETLLRLPDENYARYELGPDAKAPPVFLDTDLERIGRSKEVGRWGERRVGPRRIRRERREPVGRPEFPSTARRAGRPPWREVSGGVRGGSGTWCCACCGANRLRRCRVRWA